MPAAGNTHAVDIDLISTIHVEDRDKTIHMSVALVVTGYAYMLNSPDFD